MTTGRCVGPELYTERSGIVSKVLRRDRRASCLSVRTDVAARRDRDTRRRNRAGCADLWVRGPRTLIGPASVAEAETERPRQRSVPAPGRLAGYSPGFSPGRSTISIRAPAGPATYEKLMVGPFGKGSGRGSLVTCTFLARSPLMVFASGPLDRQPM